MYVVCLSSIRSRCCDGIVKRFHKKTGTVPRAQGPVVLLRRTAVQYIVHGALLSRTVSSVISDHGYIRNGLAKNSLSLKE
jgi:hypothetical protein